MPGGEIILVAYGEENMFLSHQPQISFFKIVYRRYSNFSIETIQNNPLYQPDFGKKFSFELSKLGDLVSKMWLVIELPNIPIIYNLSNIVDQKLKFAWCRKLAYALVEYVDIEIGGQVINRQWGEWMNVLNDFNFPNYNNNINSFIGNTSEFFDFKFTSNGIDSKKLFLPLAFWFCASSGFALPILCLEYSTVRISVKLREFNECGIFSPSNYVNIIKYYGNPIFNEPLIQISPNGVAWGTFDSIDINNVNKNDLSVIDYNLYYRKISDVSFITTKSDYFNSLSLSNILNDYINNNITKYYVIYGTKSKSIFIIKPNDFSDNAEKIYLYKELLNISLKNLYLLIDYIYIDNDERNRFYNNKHEYIIEQIYFSGNKYLQNLSSKNNLELINPCKFIVFMAQPKYFSNVNVNDFFNYTTSFDYSSNITNNISIFKDASILLNSKSYIETQNIEFFQHLLPYLSFDKAYPTNGICLIPFSLYPRNLQVSGSCNMTLFNDISIITKFKSFDNNYNKYIFKSFSSHLNILRINKGIAGCVFNFNL
jgi:hypothetical protein